LTPDSENSLGEIQWSKLRDLARKAAEYLARRISAG